MTQAVRLRSDYPKGLGLILFSNAKKLGVAELKDEFGSGKTAVCPDKRRCSFASYRYPTRPGFLILLVWSGAKIF
jgi:hypothetical protein